MHLMFPLKGGGEKKKSIYTFRLQNRNLVHLIFWAKMFILQSSPNLPHLELLIIARVSQKAMRSHLRHPQRAPPRATIHGAAVIGAIRAQAANRRRPLIEGVESLRFLAHFCHSFKNIICFFTCSTWFSAGFFLSKLFILWLLGLFHPQKKHPRSFPPSPFQVVTGDQLMALKTPWEPVPCAAEWTANRWSVTS